MLAFLPSAIYFVMAPLSVSLALWLAFAAAFTVGLRHFGATRQIRLFDITGLILFAALALYEGFVQAGAPATETSIVLAGGLLLAILWSMATNRPLTIQYRWLQKDHDPALLIHAHTLLTALWATTFAGISGLDFLSVSAHILDPGWVNILSLVLFAVMLTFTWRFGLYIDERRGNIPLLRRR